MNLYEYSPKIQELSFQLFQYTDNFDKRAFKVLKELENIAKNMDDHAFLGFVYQNYAGAYYDHNNHEKMFYYLKKALYELLRSNDRQLIARSYNLFSIEAQSYGCFEVAYQYHQLASIFIENENNYFIKAIIKSNAGDLLTDMGDSNKACEYIKEGLNIFNKCDVNNVKQQITLVTLNLGLHSIHSNKIKEAKDALNKAEKLIKEHHLENDLIVRGWLLLLKAHLALIEYDEELNNEYMNQIINEIIYKEHFVIYIKDVYRYCEKLISNKEWQKAKEIISAIKSIDYDDAPAFSKYLILNLYISYYSAIGDRDAMLEAYARKNELMIKNREEENLIHYESIQLMQLVDELNAEQKKAQEENEKLQSLAFTDALTNIPNRKALNKELENKFTKAYENSTYIGVGILDIDRFKEYNDNYGHVEGDECLKRVANILKDIGNKHQLFVSRYGGDEFVIIYENLNHKQIKEIKEEIQGLTDISLAHGSYNAIPKEKERPWDYFAKADEKLYQIKGKKR